MTNNDDENIALALTGKDKLIDFHKCMEVRAPVRGRPRGGRGRRRLRGYRERIDRRRVLSGGPRGQGEQILATRHRRGPALIACAQVVS